MCGIIGYIGLHPEQNLLNGLKKLEYRGYDSAGMTVRREGRFETYKEVGQVQNLAGKVVYKEEFGMGIAHTRWATHGKISIENTHPHFSVGGEVALVHNGIIENFEELKEKNKDVTYLGQTDSEVVAKMFESLSINSLRKVLKKLVGSYTLALLSKEGDYLYFAKNKSPLYIAKGKECAVIASDPSCFAGLCENYYQLDDGDYGKISLKNIVIYNKNHKIVEKTPQKLDFNYLSEDKSGYEHFMIKEIYQSRLALENIIEKYSHSEMKENLSKIKNHNFDRVYLVGCGTAYHAGLIGEHYLRENINIDVYCLVASEFKDSNLLVDNNSLCIFISQSGETADSISALEYCKEKGAKIVSITNVEYSTIAKMSDINLSIFAGQERAVASTKAYFAMCAVLFILSNYLKGQNYILPLKTLSHKIDFGNDISLKKLAKTLAVYKNLFFIGRGVDYVTALEASLKLKEITYIFSSALPSGELKHGSLALIDSNLPCLVIATDERQFAKTLNNASEIKSRGGKLILFTSLFVEKDVEENFDYIIKITPLPRDLMPMQIILSLQKLAYFTSLEKGNDPDKPRNLAKSVTVE